MSDIDDALIHRLAILEDAYEKIQRMLDVPSNARGMLEVYPAVKLMLDKIVQDSVHVDSDLLRYRQALQDIIQVERTTLVEMVAVMRGLAVDALRPDQRKDPS